MIQATTDDAPKSGAITPAKMDAALKAKWLAALRSGEFKQARGYLKGHTNDFCCLGVLCEVAGLEIEGSNRVAGSEGLDNYSRLYDFIGSREMSDLVAMNDGRQGTPNSFQQIADFIETNL